jgi:hypothetical protein
MILDYVNRKFDLNLIQGDITPNKYTEVYFDLADKNGESKIITGVQKLVHRILLILFTEKGSLPYRPFFGTTFSIDMKRGRWRTAAAVRSSFVIAKLDLIQQLRNLEEIIDPKDEQLEDINLARVKLQKDTVLIEFNIKTRDNAFKFIYPIKTVLR